MMASLASGGQSSLFQTESHDLMTFATVPLVLATIAIIACALPAYRASRVEPLGALRGLGCGVSLRISAVVLR